MKINKILSLTILSFALSGCGDSSRVEVHTGPKGDAGENGAPGADGKDGKDGANGHSLASEYLEASNLECATGGTRLDIYMDLDDTLSVTEGDIYSSSIVVCNGLNGLNGLAGLDGIQGATGAAGADGSNGADGATGAQGIPGAQGPVGDVGPQGIAGIQGAQGETGAQGAAGVQGAVGPQGPQGVAGPIGPVGPNGPQGIQGLQGLQGIQGPAGQNATATIAPSTSSCTLIAGNYYMKDNQLYLENDAVHCDGSHDRVELSDGDSIWVSASKLAVFDGTSLRVINFN